MKKTLLLALMSLLMTISSFGQTIVDTVDTDITTNTTWTSGRIYLLKGYRFVKDGATLTIEPGTTIRGDKASKGTLIVTRSGKIIAEGDSNNPIVFTSNEPSGIRNYGDWGGIVILGNARINVPGGTAIVEGGLLGNDAIYGGTDDDDSSGVLKYVRIEYPGIAYQPNSEINGLTLGGVGRRTVIQNIQVSYSGDDSYEWFGGNVNCKNLITYRGWDDDFDTDFGYTGMVQFALSMRDPSIADQSQSNGFESDNDGTGTNNLPITSPIFSNVTIIGPKEGGTPATLYRRALHLRRNTRTSVYNSLFVGYPTGLHIDGSAAQSNATNNILQIENVIFANMTHNFEQSSGANTWSGMEGYFRDSSRNNQTDSVHLLGLPTGYNNLTSPEFLPTPGSVLLSGASFQNTRLTDPFFTQVNYRGAFGATDWTQGWTNFRPDTLSTSFREIYSNNSTIYPNPFCDLIHIQSENNLIQLEMFDFSGRGLEIITGVEGGDGTIFTVDLPRGIYFVMVRTTKGVIWKKLVKN
jgi:hypothetical protein